MKESKEGKQKKKLISHPKQNILENIIQIENLDQEISENYLFCKFKEFGRILIIKIFKDKQTKISKGQAYITFANQDQAEKAIMKFNNQIFIRNIIKIKPYLNFLEEKKEKGIVFMHNLPEDANSQELEQEFSKYCSAALQVVIGRDSTGKQFSHGFVQFKRKEDGENLIKRIYNHPIIHKGKIVKFDKFQDQSKEKIESLSIYFKDFAPPLPQHLIAQDNAISSFEYGWSLIIKDYFRVLGDQVKDCFVQIDKVTRQPWAKITFEEFDQAYAHLNVCNTLRKHPCFNSSACNALELIKKHGPPANTDGSLAFTIQQIEQFFEEMSKDPFDIFKGESDNFFFNMVKSKDVNSDFRLIIIQNIKKNVTKEQLSEFAGQFGKVIRLTIKKTKGPEVKVQQCFVQYQTLQDSKRARSELYDDSNNKITQQKKEIFKNGRAVADILLSKTRRKKLCKSKSKNYQRRPQKKLFCHQQSSPSISEQEEPSKEVDISQQFLSEYQDYQTVQSRMEDFLKIPTDAQRSVLGKLLFQKVLDVVKYKEYTTKILNLIQEISQTCLRILYNFSLYFRGSLTDS